MTIKGVWGFNGTERPGAVYLASVLATHAQKGLPAFGIYGHEVQDRDQVACIPDDVKEKLLRFLAVQPLPLQPCGEKAICRSARCVWGSEARLSTSNLWRNISASA